MTTKSDSFAVDLSARATPSTVIQSECKKLKRVLITGIKTYAKGKEQTAHGSSQKGRWLFEVQGENSTYLLGANVLTSIAINADIPVEVKNSIKADFLNSKHYRLLQSAYSRQATMKAEK